MNAQYIVAEPSPALMNIKSQLGVEYSGFPDPSFTEPMREQASTKAMATQKNPRT